MKKLIVAPVICILGLTVLTVPGYAGNATTASLSGDPWTRIDGAAPLSGDPWTRIDGASPLTGNPWTQIDGAAPVRKPNADLDTIAGE